MLALIQVESAFRVEAVSSAGAVGLMQIMPFWIRELGLPADDLKDPWRNLRYGCTILAHYLAVERGDFTRALARYNGSLGKTWYPERVMRAWQRHSAPRRGARHGPAIAAACYSAAATRPASASPASNQPTSSLTDSRGSPKCSANSSPSSSPLSGS